MAATAVIFDIGNVLQVNPRTGWQRRWADRLHIGAHEFLRRAEPIWGPGNTGELSAEEIEAQTAAEFGLDGDALRALMEDIWTEYVGTPNQALIDYFRALRPAYRTGILSNSWSGATEREAHYGFAQMCDALVYSHEVGLAWPDPRIYHLICERLDVAPEQAVLVDDRQANLTAAVAVGMHGVRFSRNDQVIGELEALLRRS